MIFVPNAIEFNHSDKLVRRAKLGATLKRALPRQAMGISSPVTVDCVGDERSLLFRMAAKVQARDPDMLISWDTQVREETFLCPSYPLVRTVLT